MISKETKHFNKNGFTLAELLVALMVTSIILSAVAALAFAISSANDSSNDTAQKQSQLRSATLRISELIKYSRLVEAASENEITLWKTDTDGDGQIDNDERVYLGSADIIYLIPQCSNVQFALYPSGDVSNAKLVSISFDLEED
ncbi:MAG: prepilin-type N-terminal cleavage/methylation domain-containing protein, partial [Planctomycetes bacterium]|nr:prepilin-type N-terminal cleavage/methylation domain-containing protein [Planctomycetota bacterium]